MGSGVQLLSLRPNLEGKSMRKMMLLGILVACLVWAPPYIPSARQVKQAIAAVVGWVAISLFHVKPRVTP